MGDGTFVDVTAAANISVPVGVGSSAAFGDLDGVRQLRRLFWVISDAYLTHSALHHPTRAVCYALLRAHAYWIRIGGVAIGLQRSDVVPVSPCDCAVTVL